MKDNEEKIVLYEKLKEFYKIKKELIISEKDNYKHDILIKYFQTCEESFKYHLKFLIRKYYQKKKKI